MTFPLDFKDTGLKKSFNRVGQLGLRVPTCDNDLFPETWGWGVCTFAVGAR